jgi:hypothetical protein
MRMLILLPVLLGASTSALAAKKIKVAQLEQLLTADHARSDRKLAHTLSEMELTERLNTARLTHLQAGLSGSEARNALLALADSSAFLDPPPAEIPENISPPTPEQQAQFIAQARDYVQNAIHVMPNLTATQVTTSFQDMPAKYVTESNLRQGVGRVLIPYKPLSVIDISKTTVLYRDGREVVVAATKAEGGGTSANWMVSRGEFGPILTMAINDTRQGSLSWNHWELGAAGARLAVFNYTVPAGKSHYAVEFCCDDKDDGEHVFDQLPGYHGEIAIDPASGTILRLTVVADLEPTDPTTMSDIMIEYGSVEMGGKSFICPLKSIAFVQAQTEQFDVYRPNGSAELAKRRKPGPLQKLLNDATFDQYHLFRAETRILTESQ